MSDGLPIPDPINPFPEVTATLDTGSLGLTPLTVSQLRALAETEAHKRIVPGIMDQPGWKAGDPFKIYDAHDTRISYTISLAEYNDRLVTATAIMLAESGGWPNAECRDHLPNWAPPGQTPNKTKSCNAAGRGTDRGLWQFNSKAFPNISDLAAFDPASATAAAYVVTDGFKTWGPWHGSKGLDKTSPQYKAAADWESNSHGEVIDDTPGPGSLSDIVPWAAGLGKLLSWITSGAFWRRFGVGALGVGLILLALILVGVASKS